MGDETPAASLAASSCTASSAAPSPCRTCSPCSVLGPNPFREEEKRYQLHYRIFMRQTKKGKTRAGRATSTPTDLSDVLDVDLFLPGGSGASAAGHLSKLSDLHPFALPPHAPGTVVWSFARRPGFYLVRNALSLKQQQLLAEESLLRFCEPPHSTNLSAVCREALSGLFEASRQGLFLRSAKGEDVSDDGKTQRFLTDPPPSSQWAGTKPTPQSPSALSLLGRLRWASVGRHFDWTSRRYTLPRLPPLPAWLCDWAADLVRDVLAMSPGTTLRAGKRDIWYPDTGLVNYYRPGDTLGGHVDDAEKTMEDPILSLSLGLPAVFLIGGPTRAEKPLAILLRAGDALLFSGQARSCYHGVPRVLLDRDVEARVKALQGGGGEQSRASSASPCVWQTPPMHPAQLSRPESVQDWLRHVRINVSLRVAG